MRRAVMKVDIKFVRSFFANESAAWIPFIQRSSSGTSFQETSPFTVKLRLPILVRNPRYVYNTPAFDDRSCRRLDSEDIKPTQ